VRVPASAIKDHRWLGEQIAATARLYRHDVRPTIGVLWWYSASSVLLGPSVESLVATGVAADPTLESMALELHDDGRMLGATSDSLLGKDLAVLGARLHTMLWVCIEAVATNTGAPERALWAIATDSLANRVLWAGGQPAVAEEVAVAVGPKLPTPRYVEVSGRLVVRRASCCLIYQAPGMKKCTSCPRQTPAERLLRLRLS
jgi:ferric iron reductase protein FhuF